MKGSHVKRSMVLNEKENSTSKVYSLSWSEFSSSLSATAQNLRSVDDLTDVTISAGGKIFPAHKLVLGAASPLLMDLLKNTKCQHPILMLAGISASDFELILDFIYRGEISIDSDKFPSLLQAAKLLDIRALLPTALILNSLKKNAQPMAALIDNDSATHGSSPLANEDCKRADKRKAVMKQPSCLHSKITKTSNDVNGSSKTNLLECGKNMVHVTRSPSAEGIPPKTHDPDNQEANGYEEKKIISDLPVNCKFCGVKIRQSRNLRRHIDQMHSKTEFKLKSNRTKSGKRVSIGGDMETGNSVDRKDKDDSGSPLVAEFSEDTFSQLTEEILNYSAGSESDENSFPNTIAIASTSMNTCLLENRRRNRHIPPSVSASSSPIRSTQILPALLEDDICFQLSTKSNTCRTNTSHTSARIEANSSVVEQFACSHLDDSCHVNDIALKELENQLFSACFCSTENI